MTLPPALDVSPESNAVSWTAVPTMAVPEDSDVPIDGDASVSKAYACPTTGSVALNALPAWSWIVPLPVRFSPIEPLLVPVVPVAEAVTVQVADGDAETADTDESDGAVPPRLLVTNPKSEVATLLTASLNVTVHNSGPVFVGFFAPAGRLIETTVGGVKSTVQLYAVAAEVSDV